MNDCTTVCEQLVWRAWRIHTRIRMYKHTHMQQYRHICRYIHTWTGGELLFVWFAGFAPAATINSIIEVKFRHPLYPQQGRSGISGPCAKHPGGHECYCLDIKYRKFLVYKTFYKMKKLIRLIFKKLSVAYVLWTLLLCIVDALILDWLCC